MGTGVLWVLTGTHPCDDPPKQDGEPSVRGALLAKGPDTSFGEVHRGSSSSNIHMEEVVKDQEDQIEDGREKMKSAKRGSKRDQTHKRMKHG